MSRGKPYKHQKRRSGVGRFVQLPEWLQASPAWASLKPGPRALYVEMKRRFTGSNNGRIVLSHREAAQALNVHRNTIGPWLAELIERGFIHMTQGPFLGPSGVGQSAYWALDEVPTENGQEARKAFMRWRPDTEQVQKPRTMNRTPRHSESDAEV